MSSSVQITQLTSVAYHEIVGDVFQTHEIGVFTLENEKHLLKSVRRHRHSIEIVRPRPFGHLLHSNVDHFFHQIDIRMLTASVFIEHPLQVLASHRLCLLVLRVEIDLSEARQPLVVVVEPCRCQMLEDVLSIVEQQVLIGMILSGQNDFGSLHLQLFPLIVRVWQCEDFMIGEDVFELMLRMNDRLQSRKVRIEFGERFIDPLKDFLFGDMVRQKFLGDVSSVTFQTSLKSSERREMKSTSRSLS